MTISDCVQYATILVDEGGISGISDEGGISGRGQEALWGFSVSLRFPQSNTFSFNFIQITHSQARNYESDEQGRVRIVSHPSLCSDRSSLHYNPPLQPNV